MYLFVQYDTTIYEKCQAKFAHLLYYVNLFACFTHNCQTDAVKVKATVDFASRRPQNRIYF